MTLSLTWNGSALPLPQDEDAISVIVETVGGKRRTLSGAQRADVIAQKRRIVIRWDGLTETERTGGSTGLQDIYNARYATASTLVLPNGESYSVVAIDGWEETVWYDVADVPYYNVTITFSEV